MQASLRFNLDTQFSINGEPRTSVAWFNTIRVGVWLIVLAVSFAVTFNARYLYGDGDITLGLGCTSSLVSAVLLLVYVFKYPTSPPSWVEFALAGVLALAWPAITSQVMGWHRGAPMVRDLGEYAFFVLFPYAAYVAIKAVRAQKRGVERVWRKPVHTLSEGQISLPAADVESGPSEETVAGAPESES